MIHAHTDTQRDRHTHSHTQRRTHRDIHMHTQTWSQKERDTHRDTRPIFLCIPLDAISLQFTLIRLFWQSFDLTPTQGQLKCCQYYLKYVDSQTILTYDSRADENYDSGGSNPRHEISSFLAQTIQNTQRERHREIHKHTQTETYT